MRQRVAFLRTLLSGKPVLCLDEPFGALDAITRAEMQGGSAARSQREPRTVVLVTHDVEEAVMLADRVAVLSPRPGRVVAEIAVTSPVRARAPIAAVVAPARAGARGLGMPRTPPARAADAARRSCSCSRCSAPGSCTSTPAAGARRPPRPHAIAASLWSNAGLLAATSR